MPEQIANLYRIIRLIGQGGMADVYLAFDEVLNREVALKVLRASLAEDPVVLMRFLREASAVSKVHHPNIVDVFDVGESGGVHYIVMEYIEGQTLKQLIDKTGALQAKNAVQIMLQLCAGVQAAHEAKIIHRDIKPQNVLVCSDGTMKITDFGIAIASGVDSLTHHSNVMGSAHYLAPESAAGFSVDYRVDIYSLGIVMFELLCGSVPFTGTTPAAIAIKHMQDPVPDIHPYNPSAPQSVLNVVIKATAKDPNERYQSVTEMSSALLTCLSAEHAHDPKLELKAQKLELPSRKTRTDSRIKPDVQKPKKELSHIEKPGKVSKKSWFWLGFFVIVLAALISAVIYARSAGSLAFVLGYAEMPEVEQTSADYAVAALENAGFGADNIVLEYEISETVPAGEVISASRNEGDLVSRSSQIILKVSKGPSFLVSDYTGQYLSDVKQLFALNDVTINIDVSYVQAANTNPGIILSQTGVEPGDRIDPQGDETITFTVSTYPEITIPESLIGMDVNEAKEWLNEKGIAVSIKSLYDSGKVVDVDPMIGETYKQSDSDSVVTLYH
jgi:serine/threonine-protein kinase